MALIEGGDFGLDQTFDQRHDAGIHDAERQIGVATLEFTAAHKIRSGRRLDTIDPSEDVIEEDEPCVGSQATRTPIVELCKNQGRDDQILR